MIFPAAWSTENYRFPRPQNLYLFMNQLNMFILQHHLLFLMLFSVKAQSPSSQDNLPTPDMVNGFQPSLAVVIGILSIMFSLTFILLIYAKFCHRGSSSVQNNQQNQEEGLPRSRSRFSGIDKTVIESLPFFRFSSLKGSREGLDCAVCLSRFEDVEVLRLLPKCKHAFHIHCVDQWLEKHSSCPLCRLKVSADDLTLFTYTNSSRFLWNHPELGLGEDSNLELYVEREENRHGSSRFSIGSFSRRKSEKGKKEEELPFQESADSDENQKLLHKFNHKIIVPDVVLKNRWSSVSSSDLLFLSSEMTNAMSNDRFSSLDSNNQQSATTSILEDGQVMNIKEEIERKRLFENNFSCINANSSHTSKILNPMEKRSMSEITTHPRFTGFRMKNSTGESSLPDENRVKEERLRKIWLPIAQRTLQWFVNRERRSPPQTQNTRQSLNL